MLVAEGRFVDGSIMASVAPVSDGMETSDGMEVSVTRPASDDEARAGTIMMQLAIRDALACGATLPASIHDHLLLAFEELCAGYQPDLLKRQKQGHDHPFSKKLREQAIRYLRWAADKKIKDERPVKTIAAWFGVDEKTVKGWIKDWDGYETPPLDPIFTEETVIRLARFAGDRYPKRSKRQLRK